MLQSPLCLLFFLLLGEESKDHRRIYRAEQESPTAQCQNLCLVDLHEQLERAFHSLGEVGRNIDSLNQGQDQQQNAHDGNKGNGHPDGILAFHFYGKILFRTQNALVIKDITGFSIFSTDGFFTCAKNRWCALFV